MLKKLTLLSLIIVSTSPAFATNVILWGTEHKTVGEPIVKACAKQGQIVSESMGTDPKAFEKTVPNLIFAPETLQKLTKSKFLVPVDDEVAHAYVSWYYDIKIYTGRIASYTSPGSPITLDKYKSLTNNMRNLFGRVGYGISDPFTEYFKRIRIRDQKELYFKTIEEDFRNIEFQTAHAKDGVKKPASDYPFSLSTRVLEFLKNPTKMGAQAPIIEALNSYRELGKRVAQMYYEEKIKSNSAYNFMIDIPGRSDQGKNVLGFVKPDHLFSQSTLTSPKMADDTKQPDYIATVYWRDVMMTKNIVGLIKNNPKSNLLVWFGDAHTANVASMLNASKQLSNEQKEMIRVISLSNQASTACDYNKVLNSFSEFKNVQSISDWVAKK